MCNVDISFDDIAADFFANLLSDPDSTYDPDVTNQLRLLFFAAGGHLLLIGLLTTHLTLLHMKQRESVLCTLLQATSDMFDLTLDIPVDDPTATLFRIPSKSHSELHHSLFNAYDFIEHSVTYIPMLELHLSYGKYLLHYDGLSTLEAHLMFRTKKGPNDVMLRRMFCVRTLAGSAYIEWKVNSELKRWSEASAKIESWCRKCRAENSACDVPPVRSIKERRCAHTGCEVDGEGLFAAMQKCAGCRSVYYCCKQHQIAHWREHREACHQAVEHTEDV
jgi:hypothetical protein